MLPLKKTVSVAESTARKLHEIFAFIQHSEPQQIFEKSKRGKKKKIHFHHLCVFHLANNIKKKRARWKQRYYSFSVAIAQRFKLSKTKTKVIITRNKIAPPKLRDDWALRKSSFIDSFPHLAKLRQNYLETWMVAKSFGRAIELK